MKKIYETIDIELEEDIVEKLAEFGLEKIKNDRQELINDAANYILQWIVDNEEEFERMVEREKENESQDR